MIDEITIIIYIENNTRDMMIERNGIRRYYYDVSKKSVSRILPFLGELKFWFNDGSYAEYSYEIVIPESV